MTLLEGSWRCRECGAEGVLGRHKACTVCGEPRRAGTRFSFAKARPVNDASLLGLASRGPDRFCPACAGANRDDARCCEHCGRPLSFAPLTEDAFSHRWMRILELRRSGLVLVLALIASQLAVLWLYACWRDVEQPFVARVQAMQWEHEVQRQRFSPVVASDWRDTLVESPPRMPHDGTGEHPGVQNIRNCRQEIRSYESYVCGTERVCEWKTRSVACGSEQVCRTVDRGNGFASQECSTETRYCSESYEECRDETKYCQRPVYAERCDYDSFAWVAVETQRAGGEGVATSWPACEAPGPLERIVRSGIYTVELAYERDGPRVVAIHPEHEDDYQSWQGVDDATLWISHGGELRRLERDGQAHALDAAP